MHLGYPLAALLFAGAITVTAAAYFVLKIDGVLAFWIAYILTRPLGASIGDLLSQSTHDGGLGLGTTLTSAAFLIAIIGIIVYLGRAERRQERLARS